MSATADLTIARLRPADIGSIMPVERASYPAPWSVAMFILELTRAEGVALGARIEGQLAGYVICTPQGAEWHVMNVTVGQAFRRRGVARALLIELEHVIAAATGGRGTFTLEVRPSNLAAMRLYASLGYLVAGRRRAYYGDNKEDALVMWRTPSTLEGSLRDVPAPDYAEAGRWNPGFRELHPAGEALLGKPQ